MSLRRLELGGKVAAMLLAALLGALVALPLAALVLREYELRLNNIALHREIAPQLPKIFADTHQMQQVILNIVNNAVDAVLEKERRGDIWIRAWAENSTLHMEFTDSGPGVADPARVFDPFYTTKASGMGMGLSVSRTIVDAHGGRLWAENATGGGAVFRVTMPVFKET